MKKLIYVFIVLILATPAFAFDGAITLYTTDVTQSGDNTFTGTNIFNSGLISEDEVLMRDNPLTDVGYIDFNLDNGIPQAEGRMVWNDDDGVPNVGLKGGIVNLQVGLEMLIRGKNTSGSAMANGTAVRISGVSGNFPEFGFSNAADPATAGAIGITTEIIENNQFGFVTAFGWVRELDTTGTPFGEVWNDADRIWDGNADGELTNVQPTGPERKIFIGIVLNANANEGILWVNPINVSYFNELSGPLLANGSIVFINSTGMTVEDNPNLIYNQTTALLNVPSFFVKDDSGPEGQIFYHDENPTLTAVVNSSAWANVTSHGGTITNTNGSGVIYNTAAGIINTVNGGNWKATVNLSYMSSVGVPEIIHSIFLDDVEQEQCHSHRKTSANDTGVGAIPTCIITTNADSEVRVKAMSDGGTPTVTYNSFGLTIWK